MYMLHTAEFIIFFKERMKIKADGKTKMNYFNIGITITSRIFFIDIQKFVFLIQHGLAWHTKQLYEFVMKPRTDKLMFDHFIKTFDHYNVKNDHNMNGKVK